MDNQVIKIYKKVGETPLEALTNYRNQHPELTNSSLTYAGRLDPMAEGLLLVIKDEEIVNKDKYLHLGKRYEAEILLGMSSDTHDILGLADKTNDNQIIQEENIRQVLGSFQGKRSWPLPSYSSKPVKGKPLFQWSREGRISEIEIPTQNFEISEIKLNSAELISWEKVYEYITTTIDKVEGDFRQQQILQQWEDINTNVNSELFLQLIKISVHCSSGTYVRSIASKLGEELNSQALLFKLKRTQIGSFTV